MSRRKKQRKASSSAPGVSGGAPGGWLFGRSIDILLGAGVGYVLSIPPLLLIGNAMEMESWPVSAALLFALFVSGPHYGATILRVYEEREDRRRYAFFSIWVTIALCALFVFSLHEFLLGSLLVTLYATWSPWHFSGQNYGLAVMFLRRRGVALERRAKQLLQASFTLSFLLSFLALHSTASVISYASIPVGEGSVYRFLSLGLSPAVLQVVFPLTALMYICCIVGSAVLLLRRARASDLTPVLALVLVQALWFSVPAMLPFIAGYEVYGLPFAVVWVSMAHGVQYLWVTYYYARGEKPSLRLTPYLARVLFAGSMVTIFPALIFAPGLLGTVPWDNGLAILLVSVVNLHHFVLDGAIWKLRDGRVARLLLRDAASSAKEQISRKGPSPYFHPVIALLGIISLAVALFDAWEREVQINRSGNDLSRIVAATRRLAWIGRDGPTVHAQLAHNFAVEGDTETAIAEFQRSIALFPTVPAWLGLAGIYAESGRWQEAARAIAAALEIDPENEEVRQAKAMLDAARAGAP